MSDAADDSLPQPNARAAAAPVAHDVTSRSSDASAPSHAAAGHTVATLKESGFSAQQLRAAGYSVRALRAAAFTAAELYEGAGFNAMSVIAAGFSSRELKAAGISNSDVEKELGAEIEALIELGASADKLSYARLLDYLPSNIEREKRLHCGDFIKDAAVVTTCENLLSNGLSVRVKDAVV